MLPRHNFESLHDATVVLILIIIFPMPARTQIFEQSAADLVRQTVSNELVSVNEVGQRRYSLEEKSSKGFETREMIETRDWLVGRLILRNRQPLLPPQQKLEDERLRGLLKNPDSLEAFRNEQFSHKDTIRKIIAAFPDAFICQYAGTERRGPRCGLIRLKFRPRPGFTAQSVELRPLQGMRGNFWIDPVPARLARIDARFFRDVDFGWGILGHIEHGGSILFEQKHVEGDWWAISKLVLHYNKRVLLMKTRVDTAIKTYEFRHMPEDMTLQQALNDLLVPNQATMTLQSNSFRKAN
jgi:hypothetical protein